MKNCENLYFTMLDIDKFCEIYNNNLIRFYEFFGKDLENEQLESTDINSYCVNKEDFYITDKHEQFELLIYTATKNDINIVLACNKNEMIVSASINKVDNIDEVSNELAKRLYLPFLSTITGKNLEESVITYREMIKAEKWYSQDDEFSYLLDDTYVFLITNLILINFIPRKEE